MTNGMNGFWKWMESKGYAVIDDWGQCKEWSLLDGESHVRYTQQMILGYLMEYLDDMARSGHSFKIEEPWFDMHTTEARYNWLVAKISEGEQP